MNEPSTKPSNPQNEPAQGLPATVDAAVHRLLAMLPEADKVGIAAKSQHELIELHFGLGMWIRNNFGLWQGNAALAQDAGTNEPDDIAGVIIQALWNHLRGDESKRGDNLPNSSAGETPGRGHTLAALSAEAAAKKQKASAPGEKDLGLGGADQASAANIGHDDLFNVQARIKPIYPAQQELFKEVEGMVQKALGQLENTPMKAYGPYVQKARDSLKEMLPRLYQSLQASGKLETFLQERNDLAVKSILSLKDNYTREGMNPGSALVHAESDLIPELVLFLETPEQEPAGPIVRPRNFQEKQMTPLERAIGIALEAHSGQRDKAGAPYVLHPLRMMLRMESETEMMAAVLHDVVEDGPGWTFERLADEGIPANVIEAVTYLTKRPEDENDYQGFVRRAGTHPVARRVKLADLEDNMDMGRINNPTEKDFVRLAKYRSAHALLKSLGDETPCPPNGNPMNPSKPPAETASPMPSTTAPSAESSSPPKRPPKKLNPGMREFGDKAMAAMLKNLNRPGDH